VTLAFPKAGPRRVHLLHQWGSVQPIQQFLRRLRRVDLAAVEHVPVVDGDGEEPGRRLNRACNKQSDEEPFDHFGD